MNVPNPIAQLSFYAFFTKYSLMEEYGFSAGLLSRLFRKVLPVVPDENTLSYVLLHKKNAIPFVLSQLDFDTISESTIVEELDLSIKALCAKVAAFGLDKNIKAKYKLLQLDAAPFEKLLETANRLPVCEQREMEEMVVTLQEIEALITDLRRNKNKIGTNFHLTLTTRRILDYTARIKELLRLKLNIDSKTHWENILFAYIEYDKHKNSIRRYLRRRTDLVALEIVEHTSDKGEKYIAENRKEYWGFFYKALLGGGIIALFALLKLWIDAQQLTKFSDALFFSLNYALCFILVKQLGGTIATKQPAMTASTIAENIDEKNMLAIDSMESIITLVRKVFRSQFISIVGNFLMALGLASIIMWLLQWWNINELTKVVKPAYLIKKVVPTGQLMFFAAIAGCYLALSGLISGYIDNKIVASNIAYRISNTLNSKRAGAFVKKNAGSLLGNLALGFLLGSTFLLSDILPFKVDIRHIAFSSAYVGYATMSSTFALNTVLLALSGALLIGFINFIVSFSITLYLALKSRGANLNLLPQILWRILKDFFRHPLYYLVKM